MRLIPLSSESFLGCFAETLMAQLMLEQALIARNKLAKVDAESPDGIFYRGKIETAKYFCRNILPNAFTRHSSRKTLQLWMSRRRPFKIFLRPLKRTSWTLIVRGRAGEFIPFGLFFFLRYGITVTGICPTKGGKSDRSAYWLVFWVWAMHWRPFPLRSSSKHLLQETHAALFLS